MVDLDALLVKFFLCVNGFGNIYDVEMILLILNLMNGYGDIHDVDLNKLFIWNISTICVKYKWNKNYLNKFVSIICIDCFLKSLI